MDRTDRQLLIERERRAYIEGRVEEAALLTVAINEAIEGDADSYKQGYKDGLAAGGDDA
jgi:hypothetical protein